MAIAKVLTRLDKIYEKIRRVVRTLKKGCFAPGTLVLLASGDVVPIEEIEVGDVVACEEEFHAYGLEPGVESERPVPPYPTAVRAAAATIRAVDDTYFYIYTTNRSIVESLRQRFGNDELVWKKPDELSFPT